MKRPGFLLIESIIYITLTVLLMGLALSGITHLMKQSHVDRAQMLTQMTVASAFDRLVSDVANAQSISVTKEGSSYRLQGSQQIDWVIKKNRLMRRVHSAHARASTAVVSDGVQTVAIHPVAGYTICRLEVRGCAPLVTAIKR